MNNKVQSRKNQLIRAIAEYLTNDQARKSLDLELNRPYAKEWAKVRNLTSVRGYATADEAVVSLSRDLA